MSASRPPLSRATTSQATTTINPSGSTPSALGTVEDPVFQRSSSAPPTQAPIIDSAVAEENEDDEYDEEDARRMSPRRNSEELERIGTEARAVLEKNARMLQDGLQQLLDRVDKVKEEHERLDSENRFLQEYIGSLMATSRVTAGSGSNQGGRVR